MWGELLSLFGSIAEVAADKILMRHIDTFARLEKELFALENAPINDQDDVRIVEVKKLMHIEKRAILAQLQLRGKR